MRKLSIVFLTAILATMLLACGDSSASSNAATDLNAPADSNAAEKPDLATESALEVSGESEKTAEPSIGSSELESAEGPKVSEESEASTEPEADATLAEPTGESESSINLFSDKTDNWENYIVDGIFMYDDYLTDLGWKFAEDTDHGSRYYYCIKNGRLYNFNIVKFGSYNVLWSDNEHCYFVHNDTHLTRNEYWKTAPVFLYQFDDIIADEASYEIVNEQAFLAKKLIEMNPDDLDYRDIPKSSPDTIYGYYTVDVYDDPLIVNENHRILREDFKELNMKLSYFVPDLYNN